MGVNLAKDINLNFKKFGNIQSDFLYVLSIMAPVISKPKTKSGNMLPSIDILK